MSQNATNLFQELGQGIKHGLARMGAEIVQEVERQIPLGASELANFLFKDSSAFVQYGPYSRPIWGVEQEPAQALEQQQAVEHELDRGLEYEP